MAKFFIDRPIFAWVLAIVMMLAGAMALKFMPVEQYPDIAPPKIQITAKYPGASADAIANSVTQVIEQQMSGIDHLLYMSSTSNSAGIATITLTFAAGTNPDIAQVQVQNKLQLATPRLPQIVQQLGISVTKSSSTFLMVLAFVSETGAMTPADLGDYVGSNIVDPISRIEGVGQAQLFGSEYAMRVWLNPHKLTQYHLNVTDVIQAIKTQNNQIAGGQIGGTPAAPGQQISASIVVQTMLSSPEEFGKILLRVNPDGSKVLLRDVAQIKLGQESYAIQARFDGKPAAVLGINLATGANALATHDRVMKRIKELEQFFPADMKVVNAYDTTPFVRISINEVMHTLIEAIVLVFLVMLLFLQNIRATLIPTIAVPVVLLGTFGVLHVFGFSINTLTMFGLVLAIGLLVDDAIVVVENTERVMEEEQLSPREAARRSMGELTGALVGIGLVLSAVFIPMAFFPGSSGGIYRQFSVTIVTAMVLSVLTALILTPALCATMLKPKTASETRKGGFFGWFNRVFAKGSNGYQSSVEKILGKRGRYLLIYVVIVAVLGVLMMRLPTAFLPSEDQGFLLAQVQLKVGSSQAQTIDVLKDVEDYFQNTEKDVVQHIFVAAGFSFAGRGQNSGIAFINLKPWEERDLSKDSAQQIAGRAMRHFSQNRDAMIFALNPPAIHSLGVASGFNFELQDRSHMGADALAAATRKLVMAANKSPVMMRVRHAGLPEAPEYHIDIDHEKAKALGVSLAAINATLTTGWGGSYVNDFVYNGRIKRVYVQGKASSRMMPTDLSQWRIRNNKGEMVPFSAFASGHWEYGPQQVEHYNGVPSMNIQGSAAPGYSSGDAMNAIAHLADTILPEGFGYEWTGLSYEERQSGDQAPLLYAISMLFVFLCLAALYESWSIPFSVMLVVPLGVLGAVLAAWLRGLDNDIFFQVGLITTIGLSAKNAILIVEFAKELEDKGKGLLEATLEATRKRFRPILMTSMAFMLGVTPLMLSTGAGSGARTSIGTGVFGGMFTATVLAIFFIPLFYVVVRRLSGVPLRKLKSEDLPPPT